MENDQSEKQEERPFKLLAMVWGGALLTLIVRGGFFLPFRFAWWLKALVILINIHPIYVLIVTPFVAIAMAFGWKPKN